MKWLRSLGIFAGSAVWFSAMLSWTGFSDPDAFYHAHASLLMWQHGPIMSFPWLDLTLLGSHFADLHFLFHVWVAPFAGLFGQFLGLRIATVILASIAMVVIEACLRWIGVRWPIAWTVMLLGMYGFLYRMLLGKATPLAMIWYVLGVCAAVKRKPWLVFLAALGYALSHGGWIYLVGSIPVLLFDDVIFSHVVDRLPLKQVLRKTMWPECLAAIGGALLGLLIHPNRSQIFVFAWTQVVTIGLGTPFQHVQLGTEWLPSDPNSFVVTIAPLVILLMCGLVAFMLAPRRPLDKAVARLVTAFGWLVAIHFALTLKSRRDIEFLVPFFLIWVSLIWTLVDPEKAFDEFANSKSRLLRLGPWLVICCFFALIGSQIQYNWVTLHPPTYPDNVYQSSIQAISSRAQPGNRVFHSSWDEFPMLFAADDRLKYISGMDPTFLYVASSTLSDQVKDLTAGVVTSTDAEAWSLIHDQLNAKFVFVSKELHGKFLDLLKTDTRFIQINDATDSAAFEVRATTTTRPTTLAPPHPALSFARRGF